MSSLDAPIPLSDIEAVLAWVDTFKLSRPTKKINRDFSDAVLLAEILSVYYPKLVEMHNYPPRNSHALKLNNWMTLNRKVLKKLRLNLCCGTMEQLAAAAPGVIERVLIMVREKIRRDEEAHKKDEGEQNMSSGGSYYEAVGDEEHVLVVPLKTRVNGVLETIQQKVVSHEAFANVKQELKDAKDCIDVLRNKVEHLDNLLKLKEERIEELQNQLERKQTRRKEVEALHTSLSLPYEAAPPTPKVDTIVLSKIPSLKSIEFHSKIPKPEDKTKEELKVTKPEELKNKPDEVKLPDESKIPIARAESAAKMVLSKPSLTEVQAFPQELGDGIVVETIKTEGFKQIEIVQQKVSDDYLDVEDFKDSEDEAMVVRIEDTIQKEIKEIADPLPFPRSCEMSFKTMQFN